MLLAQNLEYIQKEAFLPDLPKNLGIFIASSNIINYVFGAAALALLVYLVLGGLQMMTSQGEPKAMQGAQAKITNALIGFVIIVVAFFVVQIIGKLFGLQGTLFGQVFGTK